MVLLQNDTITPAELEKFLTNMLSAIKQTSDGFMSMSAELRQQLHNVLQTIANDHAALLSQVDDKTQAADQIFATKLQEVSFLIDEIKALELKDGQDGLNGADGKDGNDGKDGSPDTGQQIVVKINDLSTDDEQLKIDALHIKNLPEVTQRLIQHGGFRNLSVYDETTLITKFVRFLKFVGAGVQATAIGDVVTVTIPGASSSLTAADELATDSGDHTTFTIAHTPVASTLLVINENTGQAVPASAYTNTTTSITFNQSQQVDDGTGNLVTPTFRARYFY